MKNNLLFTFFLASAFSHLLMAKEETKPTQATASETVSKGLKFRNIGPSTASGRILDIAVNPQNQDEFYIATAGGGVWKTSNHGTSFQPIFDGQKSFSIGCITIDPTNTNTVWVGSGENNSQRAVSYGDGIYKSQDGGKTWKNMGLKTSEHIGKIYVDSKNPNTVIVACQGPLWNPGGERGLYKTTDGGETWKQILKISDNTGVTDFVVDPRNQNVIYAASYQRRRHVWTLINGGPEAAVHKTTNGGETWQKLAGGLPAGDLGRIGLAMPESNPDIVYALIEANDGKAGLYKTNDRGASWNKTNNIATGSAQYYQELFIDPSNENTIYSVSTYTQVSRDGGVTFSNVGIKEKHVDDHAVWIDPKNSKHFMIGCDGGLYETWDNSATWKFFNNLPITQFYRVTVDNTEPFYWVYGGTQDNNTLGGPSRTKNAFGIMNQDWLYTVGGDGFKTVVDPKDPNIVYSEPQYGVLVRYDKRSGEMTMIQPQADKGEELRWNWDSPVIISPHSNTRLYFAANKLFKSDDRGNSWTKISGDLTRQINRDELKVMDKIWEPEAIAKNASTSLYGNIIALDESPIKAGLLYVGTDDGLLQISENDGQTWNKVEKFPGVPESTYVSDIQASRNDENVVYITFDNHKMGDYKPYVLKSNDKGKTWTSIASNLPIDGAVYTIAEDGIEKNLLFCGTEFGFYFTIDGGAIWNKLDNGLPSTPVKDIDIQRRENDIAIATFGRGFYILDDYTPLRNITKENMDKEAFIFPIKDSWIYREDESWGRKSLGEDFYRAENHPFGAVFTYNLNDTYQTKKDLRKKKSKEQMDKSGNPYYPTFDEMREEDLEQKPMLIFTIADDKGSVVRNLTTTPTKGTNRLVWNLRYSDTDPIAKTTDINKNNGILIIPGTYYVSISKVVDGVRTQIAEPQKFVVKSLNNTTLPAKDKVAMISFQQEAMEFRRKFGLTNSVLNDLKEKTTILVKSILSSPVADNEKLLDNTYRTMRELEDVNIVLNGDNSKGSRSANQTPAVRERLDNVLWSFWESFAEPTQTSRNQLKIANELYTEANSKLKRLSSEVEVLISKLKTQKAPLPSGNMPD